MTGKDRFNTGPTNKYLFQCNIDEQTLVNRYKKIHLKQNACIFAYLCNGT